MLIWVCVNYFKRRDGVLKLLFVGNSSTLAITLRVNSDPIRDVSTRSCCAKFELFGSHSHYFLWNGVERKSIQMSEHLLIVERVLYNIILKHFFFNWIVLEVFFETLIADDLLLELEEFLFSDSLV